MTLKQLAFESKASQDGWEMWQILKQVKELRPKTVVEIGVDGGGSMETWKKAFDPPLLVGIDINQRAELTRYNMVYGDSLNPHTKAELQQILGGNLIDFLWLDGDHHYRAVKEEFALYGPLVRSGGIIGFHDTNSRGIEGVEVNRFMADLDEHQTFRTADFRLNKYTPGSRLIWLS